MGQIAGRILSGTARLFKRAYVSAKEFYFAHREAIQLAFTSANLILLIGAILISVGALKESKKFGGTMIAQMDTLSSLFSRVNQQISYLPASVSTFDSTIRRLDEGISGQQQEFQRSIGGLQKNIDAFSQGIVDYGRTLAKIVGASDKQLSLLEARQRLLEKELMRKPKLEVAVKRCEKDTLGRLRIAPKITNQGDEIATFCRLVMRVPAEFEFQSSGFVVWDSAAPVESWTYQHNAFVPYGYGLMLSNPRMEFTIRIPSGLSSSYQFRCFLYHNKGVNADTLTIDPSQCE